MTITRQDVWKHLQRGSPWSDSLLWYARAVGEMQKRPITDKTSWRYLAAMHGFEPSLWRAQGYLQPNEKLPPQAEQDRYWQQCQHQSWYFLPWHRAYLRSFEEIVRATIAALEEPGAPRDWALPYWNYSDRNDPNALKLPAAFAQKSLPDGSPNPLFVKARFGASVAAADVDLTHRLAEDRFTGTTVGVLHGIGGPRTPFSHSGEAEGLIEAAPHDLVHVDVGGRGGLMSDPRTAALDPVFWVHHSNIDRLWVVWRHRKADNHDPTDSAWLKGPANRRFATFDAQGKDLPSTPGDVLDVRKLGYDYEDISDPLKGAVRRKLRLDEFAAAGGARIAARGQPMAEKPTAELLGAGDRSVRLGHARVSAEVKLAAAPRSRLSESFAQPGDQEPDRVFLNLENIRGSNGAAKFDVFLGSKKPGAAAPRLVGTFSLFGLEAASDQKGAHGGKGLSKVLEVTQVVDAMHLGHELDSNLLEVQIVPRSDVRDDDGITIGHVSLYRQRQP
ncbi:MAG TPA: tyrosinase family protein [Steroidobacteraceae bacterium]|nr:tyrosinase family protein [Steroidobacteraceae bacterium]